MFFVGSHELIIDSKNRLSIPVDLRTAYNGESDGRALYVRPGRCRGTLELWPDRHFQQMWKDHPPTDVLSDDAFAWRQYELANTVLVTPDNQGRVLIPEALLERAGLGKEVALIGVYDHMELWNRQSLAAYLSERVANYEQNRAKAVRETLEFSRGRAVSS